MATGLFLKLLILAVLTCTIGYRANASLCLHQIDKKSATGHLSNTLANPLANPSYNESFKAIFYQNLKGPNANEQLNFRWKVPYSQNLSIQPNGLVEIHYDLHPYRTFFGNTSNPNRPLVSTIDPQHAPFLIDSHYLRVYERYTDPAKQKALFYMDWVDKTLPAHRTSIGQVTNVHGNSSAFGSMRIFDLSQNRKDLVNVDRQEETEIQNRYKNNPLVDIQDAATVNTFMSQLLPFERLNNMRNIEAPISRKMIEEALADGLHVFEVGKFVVDASTPQNAARTRHLLELFWMNNYAVVYKQGLFFAHATSLAHVRLYSKRYGMKLVENYQVPGSPEGEYVLVADGTTIANKIASQFNIPISD